MPTSDEFFDPGQTNNYKVTMMTDQLPAGMFDKEFSAGKHGEPTPEDMEAAAEAVRYEKIVEVKEFHVGTYDLSDKASLAEYKRDVVVLYKLQREKRGVISFLEKKFIMHEGKPKMTVHMEWYEYNLKVTDHMTGRHFKTAAEFSEHKHEEAGRGGKKVGDSPGSTLGGKAGGKQGKAARRAPEPFGGAQE